MSSSDHHISASPELQPKRKRHAMQVGPGYIEYQANVIVLDPFCEENVMGCKHFVKPQQRPTWFEGAGGRRIRFRDPGP